MRARAECRRCGETFSYLYRGINCSVCEPCKQALKRVRRRRSKSVNRDYLGSVRDGWRCNLCGVLLDRSLAATYPSPRYPCVYWLRPIGFGGEPTGDNARLGCLSCVLRLPRHLQGRPGDFDWRSWERREREGVAA